MTHVLEVFVNNPVRTHMPVVWGLGENPLEKFPKWPFHVACRVSFAAGEDKEGAGFGIGITGPEGG